MNEYLKYKKLYPEYLILIKCGKFYYVYGDDCYIINYYFNYQIIKNRTAFPETILEKIKRILELEKFAYLIIDKKVVYSFKAKDYILKYNKLLVECKKTYEYKRRIESIKDKLLFYVITKDIDEKLMLIEEIL